ncbi:hypothetical protein CU098_001673, partial [Rhizopus stolonifer]
YANLIRSVHPEALLFVQPPVLEVPPHMPASLDRLVYAPHWYDGLTLVKKKWCNYNVDFINLNRGKYGTGPLRFLRALRVGEKAIRQCFVDQLSTIKTEGLDYIGDYPCIMGEIGIPYDMETGVSAKAFSFSFACWWNWLQSFFVASKEDPSLTIGSPLSSQNKALDANLNAMEKNLLNYSLWNYVPDNDAQWGDLWNGEDLSIWQTPADKTTITMESVASSSTVTPSEEADKLPWSIDAYGKSTDSLQSLLRQHQQQANCRNVVSLHRPHPRLTAGVPLTIHFVSPTEKLPASFEYTIKHRSQCDGPTEIFVPSCYFPPAQTKIASDYGDWKEYVRYEHYWVLHWTLKASDYTEAKITLEGVSLS